MRLFTLKHFKKCLGCLEVCNTKNDFKIFCCILIDIFLRHFKGLLISVASVIKFVLYTVLTNPDLKYFSEYRYILFRNAYLPWHVAKCAPRPATLSPFAYISHAARKRHVTLGMPPTPRKTPDLQAFTMRGRQRMALLYNYSDIGGSFPTFPFSTRLWDSGKGKTKSFSFINSNRVQVRWMYAGGRRTHSG